VLEAQPLHRVIQLDVHAQVVGVHLELVAVSQAAVLVDVHGQRGHRSVDGEPPVPVAAGLHLKADRCCVPVPPRVRAFKNLVFGRQPHDYMFYILMALGQASVAY